MAGTITALQIQVRRKDRVNVFLDDAYAFSLQSVLAVKLHRGQYLTDEEIASLRSQDAGELAYERSLHYLSFRPRSEEEMRRYLGGKGVEETHIAAVLTRLKRAHLVDDHEFARFWVENRMAHRPRGRRALRSELMHKGVSSDIIDASIQDIDEEALALQAAQKVVHRLAKFDQRTFTNRLLAYLQRRGFSYDVSRDVVKLLWQRSVAEQGT